MEALSDFVDAQMEDRGQGRKGNTKLQLAKCIEWNIKRIDSPRYFKSAKWLSNRKQLFAEQFLSVRRFLWISTLEEWPRKRMGRRGNIGFDSGFQQPSLALYPAFPAGTLTSLTLSTSPYNNNRLTTFVPYHTLELDGENIASQFCHAAISKPCCESIWKCRKINFHQARRANKKDGGEKSVSSVVIGITLGNTVYQKAR